MKILNFAKNYGVTKCGQVWSLKRKTKHGEYSEKPKLKKLTSNSSGYLVTSVIDNNGVKKIWLVHRLVALAFIPNEDNKPVVNHIDGVKHNNTVHNLEWCTSEYNNKHAVETGLHKGEGPGRGVKNPKSKAVRQLSLNGKFIATFESCNIAAQALGKKHGRSQIASAARGVKPSVYGFKWEYT